MSEEFRPGDRVRYTVRGLADMIQTRLEYEVDLDEALERDGTVDEGPGCVMDGYVWVRWDGLPCVLAVMADRLTLVEDEDEEAVCP